MGVSVRVGDKVFRCVQAVDVETLFEQQVMPQMVAVA